MAANAKEIKYSNYNGGENHTDDSTDRHYIKSTEMSQHGMSNSSSRDKILQNNLMPSVALQDIGYHRSFTVKDQYDSTSVENISGKILSSTCLNFFYSALKYSSLFTKEHIIMFKLQ